MGFIKDVFDMLKQLEKTLRSPVKARGFLIVLQVRKHRPKQIGRVSLAPSELQKHIAILKRLPRTAAPETRSEK